MPIEGIEWDSVKSLDNILSHNLSFEDARYVFADKERIERYDRSENNTSDEDRW
jgi:uncharacterized DUF497 family protein